MKRFADKIVLVSGGASGIGLACCHYFTAEGAIVITTQRRTAESHKTVTADLSDASAPREIIAEVIDSYGGLDVLVNNAGIMLEGSVEEMPLEEWEKTLQINLTAPFLLMKYALPHLCKRQGAIVNISSIEALGSNPRHPAYCASKSGLLALTRAVAVDAGRHKVRCNAVVPGWIDTDLNIDFIESQNNPKTFKEKLGDIHPIGRTGTPEEVAALVAWLASDEAAFITGQHFTIDGGRTAKLSLP